jgi:hypothetical protein
MPLLLVPSPSVNTSVVLPQIHPVIKMRYLFRVTVEKQCISGAEGRFADPVLLFLAPARMRNIRIYV